MFTQDELKANGAKKGLLEYIVSCDPLVPVPETVLPSQIGSGTIVRSDHWREFDLFEGIFDSVVVGRKFYGNNGSHALLSDPQQILDYMHFKEIGVEQVDRVARYKRHVFEEYCSGLSLDPEEVLGEFSYFVQKKVDARTTGTIFAHPHDPCRYLVYADGIGNMGDYNVFFIVDVKDDDFSVMVENNNGGFPPDMFDEIMDYAPMTITELKDIVALYQKVHSFPKFTDEYVYMMEFSVDPTCVFQMRQFRKKETSNFDCSWAHEKNVYTTDVVFGLTPPEGIVLPYYHFYNPGFPLRNRGNIFITEQFWDFVARNKDGFAYSSSDETHMHAAFPSARAALADTICHNFSHGALANMAHLPLYFSLIGGEFKHLHFPEEMVLRLFSNGRQGYVKIEE